MTLSSDPRGRRATLAPGGTGRATAAPGVTGRAASAPGGGDRAAARRSPAERRCTRNGCRQPAVATLTYVYAASTAVVGPLATVAEPHTYDLCAGHARTLTAPRGWELVRHDGELAPPPVPDDLAALAEALWSAAPAAHAARPPLPRRRSGHLRVVPPA